MGSTAKRGDVRTLEVTWGRVACPRHGDLSVERCYACEFLEGPDDDIGFDHVECALPVDRPFDATDLVHRFRERSA